MADNDNKEESYVWAAGLDPGAILLDVNLNCSGRTELEWQVE